MEQYIKKSALVAKIEKKIKQYEMAFDNPSFASYEASLIAKGKYRKLLDILQFIDTLEVKEVDLDAEIMKYQREIYDRDTTVRDVAKHFFELGLHSTITEEDCKLIWNIGDDLPYMPEEDFFKELLQRYKTQKGEEL